MVKKKTEVNTQKKGEWSIYIQYIYFITSNSVRLVPSSDLRFSWITVKSQVKCRSAMFWNLICVRTNTKSLLWGRQRASRSQIRITRQDKIPKGLRCVIFCRKFRSSHATNSHLKCSPHGFQTSSQAYLGGCRWQATPSRLSLACSASSGMQSGNSGWLKRFIHFCVNVYASAGQASPGSSHTFP